MIMLIIAWLIKKCLPAFRKKRKQNITDKKIFRNAAKLFIVLTLFSVRLIAQQQVYHYNVLYKGNSIGKMHLTQTKNGEELTVKVISNIQMRMLMTVKVSVAEESSYLRDKLMYSSVHREVNGRQKANRQTKYSGDGYQITAEGKTGTLNNISINFNLARLYCKEPLNINLVYSDNFQQFFSIQTIASHTYRLNLPDGNYNIYYYENGICNKADVHSKLFTIQMQLAA